MPPRKATAAGPSKRKRDERFSLGQKFFNDEAKSTCIRLATKEGIKERGIYIYVDELGENIKARRWSTFVAEPEAAILPLVREFYANAREQLKQDSTVRKVLVRGWMVPFDRSSINRVYDLEDIEADEYSALLDQAPNFDDIIHCLAQPGSQWKKNRDRIVNLPRKVLLEDAWAWHYFISAKLLPSTHVSDVSLDRAILNYAIQKKLSLDVGKLIEQSIVNFATGRLSSALGHPSLICQLCEGAGVSFREDEETQDPLPIIDFALRLSWRKARASSPHVATMDSAAVPPPRRMSSEAGPSQPSPPANPSYAELQRQIKELRVAHSRFARRTSRQLEYVVGVCSTLVAAFQSGSLPAVSRSSFSFPAPPDISPPHPDADAADAESD